MKALVHRLYSDPRYAKALHFGKLFTITGSAQLVIQTLGFLSGIIIIRVLSTEEYAWYTIANMMLGTMIMLADSGISNGVMAEGGKYWQDKKKLGIVLATGLELRKKFGLISLIVISPILGYLLLEHGSSWLTACLIILAIIPAFFAALSDSLLEIVPKLHQDIPQLQKNQVEVSLARLVFSASFLFFFPFTYIALVANSIPRIYGNYKLRKISAGYANQNEKSDPVVRKQVMKSVKQVLPNAIYHSLSGQLSILIISFFGTTSSVSELGALGRLAVIFNLFSVVFSTIAVPRFSRMNAVKNVVLKRFLLIQGGVFFTSAVLLLLIGVFSKQLLWLLGKNYHGLNYELFLIGLSSCVGLMVDICGQALISRGWYLKAYLFIAINFTSTVVYLVFFKVSNLAGVLYFNIVVSCIFYIILFMFGLRRINKITQ